MCDFSGICENMVHKLEKDPTILYELSNLEWIKCIIIEYNRLGFFTYTSQPGSERNNVLFKSEYHRRISNKEDITQEFLKENIIHHDAVRKQRAYIRGYMNIKMADFVFQKLEHDPYLFVRTTNNNRHANFQVKFGSVNFWNEQPVLNEEIVWHDIEETKNIPDADWSFNFSLSLRRPLTEMLKIRPLSEMFDKEYQNIDCADIVEFEIIDTRWNENSYLWNKLLETIRAYQKV